MVHDDAARVARVSARLIRRASLFETRWSLDRARFFFSSVLARVDHLGAASSLSFSSAFFQDTCVSSMTFIVYSSLGNDLEASVVFPSIALFVIMVIPLQLVPMGIGMATELKVGARVVLCPHVGVRS